MRVFRWTLVLAVPLLAGSAQAHDPGLSSLEFQVHARGLRASLTLARADADALVQARGPLEQLAGRLVEVQLDGRPVAGTAAVEGDAGNVRVTLDYGGATGGRLAVRSGIFGLLPRGHRQVVTLLGRAGRPVVERMLAAGSDGFAADLDVAPPAVMADAPRFFALGVEHILTGWDHLVFVVGLLLGGARGRALVRIVTSFTVAHSITLALAALDVVAAPARVVEPAIALSILYVGLENIFSRSLERRWLLTFGFGLVHGFGFAAALRGLGLAPGAGLAGRLLSFNVGVESGQLAVAVVVLPLVTGLRRRPELAARWMPACSALVALAGLYWFVTRLAA